MAGCTANVVLITKKQIIVANAGDARCYLFTKDGKYEALSEDHKPELPEELARIEKAGGYVKEGRINENLNLSRALGDLEYKKNPNMKPEEQMISAEPDIVVREITPEFDYLLMGCDGIWETKTEEEIGKMITEKESEEMTKDKISEYLLDQLIAKETSDGTGCDNMSCILIKFK